MWCHTCQCQHTQICNDFNSVVLIQSYSMVLYVTTNGTAESLNTCSVNNVATLAYRYSLLAYSSYPVAGHVMISCKGPRSTPTNGKNWKYHTRDGNTVIALCSCPGTYNTRQYDVYEMTYNTIWCVRIYISKCEYKSLKQLLLVAEVSKVRAHVYLHTVSAIWMHIFF